MGLASALAAQQAAYQAVNNPSQPQQPIQQHLQQTWAPQAGTGPAVAPAAALQPAPPAAPHQAAGSPAGMQSVIASRLQQIVTSNDLSAFYPPSAVQQLAQRVAQRVDFHQLAARWRMPVELAVDLSALALYDVVIYADDSGSMESEGGERIEDLKLIVGKVAEVATLFDDDGIEVRFINSDLQGNHIRMPDEVNRLISSISFNCCTPIGTQLEAKVLTPLAYRKRLQKPVLIITVTDGEPTDTPADKLYSVVKECSERMVKQGLGPHAVAFQFAQVGRDRGAQAFLAQLDNDPKVGHLIDCTSYFELEQAEYASKGINLSVEAWLVKLMTGAIDRSMDSQDESTPSGHAGSNGHQKKKKKGLLQKLFG